MVYCVKIRADPNHLYAFYMLGNCFREPYARSNTVEKPFEVFIFSQCKNKGLFIEIGNRFKHVIFSMCILVKWCKTLPQDAKPCVHTGREDACLVRKDAEIGLVQILHQDTK